MSEKSYKGRDEKDINCGDRCYAGRRCGPELAVVASWAKTKPSGKETESWRVHARVLRTGSTIEGQQSGLTYNRGYHKLQLVTASIRKHRFEYQSHAHAG